MIYDQEKSRRGLGAFQGMSLFYPHPLKKPKTKIRNI
jgi:hypothetical protein